MAVASCDDVRTLMYGGSNSVMTPNVWTFWPFSYQGCFVVVLTSAVRKKNALLGGLDFAQWSSKDPSHIFYMLMHSELEFKNSS